MGKEEEVPESRFRVVAPRKKTIQGDNLLHGVDVKLTPAA